MNYDIYNLSDDESLWGRTDILTIDSELNEYNDNYSYNGTPCKSIFDEDVKFISLLNFAEEQEDELYNPNNDKDNYCLKEHKSEVIHYLL